MTPLKAIRTKCLWCCDGSAREVTLCPVTACPSWAFRFGRKPDAEVIAEQADTALHPLEYPMTAAALASPLKAIRRKCLDCSGASKAEVRDCDFDDCALHPFRLGTNPNRSYSPEARAVLAERLSLLRGGISPEITASIASSANISLQPGSSSL